MLKNEKYKIENIKNKIIHGDVISELKKIPDESINTVITSPPYFGLRSYDSLYNKEFSNKENAKKWILKKEKENKDYFSKIKEIKDIKNKVVGYKVIIYSKFIKKNQVGLEETSKDYINRMVEIAKEVKRVLKKTGSFWLNIGDSYNTKSGSGMIYGNLPNQKEDEYGVSEHRHTKRGGGEYPTKCLLQIPQRIAIALTDKVGFTLRNDIIWCLSKNTPMIAMINKSFWFGNLQELFEIYNSGLKIQLPTITKDGHQIWVKLKKIWKTGKQKVSKITLTNGLTVYATKQHHFPVLSYGSTAKKHKKSYLKMRTQNVGSINKNNSFYAIKKLDIGLPRGNKKDYDLGFLIGFFLAEGNFEYNVPKKDGTKTLRGFRLTCGHKDRKHMKRFNQFGKWSIQKSRSDKSIIIRILKGKKLATLFRKYINGHTSHNKRLNVSAFNRSIKFLEGILKGFLDGDGTYCKDVGRYRVAMCLNYKLINNMMLIARIIGWEFRLENLMTIKPQKEGMRFKKKEYLAIRFNTRPFPIYRTTKNDIYWQRIRNIKSDGIQETFDLEVEPIFKTKDHKNKTLQKNLDKWNNLFCIGNGILTHNSKQVLIHKKNSTIGNVMPSSVKDRLNNSYEHLFFFTKNRKYYFDLDSIRIPHQTQSLERYQRAVNLGAIQVQGKMFEDKVDKPMQPPKVFREKFGKDRNYKGKFSGTGKESENYGSPRARNERISKIPSANTGFFNKEPYEENNPHRSRLEREGLVPGNTSQARTEHDVRDLKKYNEIIKGKNLPDSWQINTQPSSIKHFALFPVALLSRPIKTCLPKKGIILDPFFGGGTTAIAQRLYKPSASYIGIEINKSYIKIAEKRIKEESPDGLGI